MKKQKLSLQRGGIGKQGRKGGLVGKTKGKPEGIKMRVAIGNQGTKSKSSGGGRAKAPRKQRMKKGGNVVSRLWFILWRGVKSRGGNYSFLAKGERGRGAMEDC